MLVRRIYKLVEAHAAFGSPRFAVHPQHSCAAFRALSVFLVSGIGVSAIRVEAVSAAYSVQIRREESANKAVHETATRFLSQFILAHRFSFPVERRSGP